jgi:hypothetical protein
MNLYIQTKNGQVINHPAIEHNLIDAFGKVPNDWVPFTRFEQPTNDILPVGPYQLAVVNYVPDGMGWKDSWSVREMTQEEKQEKITAIKSIQPFNSWTFNETICQWEAPVARPEGNYWGWDEDTLSWKDFSPTPPLPVTLSDVSFV